MKNGMLVRGFHSRRWHHREDVTPNVKTVRSIPLRMDDAAVKKLKLPKSFARSRRILMTRKAFEL